MTRFTPRNHTRGPWLLEGGDILVHDKDGDDKIIAGIGKTSQLRNHHYSEVRSNTQAGIANGFLIRAAPEMLDALCYYRDTFCEHGEELCGRLSDDDCSGCKAHNVIMKAIGKTK